MDKWAYILLSLKDNRTYTGSTDNLERRLQEHGKGLVKSTRDRLPIKLLYSEIYPSLAEARKKEKYYKSCSGRKKLKVILKDILQ